MNDLTPQRLSLTLTTIAARVLDLIDAPDGADALRETLAALWSAPGREDAGFVQGAQQLGLTAGETVLLSLALGIETEPDIAARIVALQEGSEANRPTAYLFARLLHLLDGRADVSALLRGPLFSLHLIRPMPSRLPLVNAPLAVADALLSVRGLPSAIPLPEIGLENTSPPSYHRVAREIVDRLEARPVCIVLRGGAPGDQRMMAGALAQAMGKEAVLPSEDHSRDPALGPALTLGGNLIAQQIPLSPGSRVSLSPLQGYAAPRLVLAGTEGGVDAPGCEIVDLPLPDLPQEERLAVWSEVAQGTVACPEGPGPAGLRAIATRMRVQGQGYRVAAGAEARSDLEPHGRLVSAHVGDEALVLSQSVKAEFDLLLERCRQRRAPKEMLGPAYHARGMQTGVRAMLCGVSGGGKTLACSWLASKLDMPLFKVDLASVTSKYIGETEEHVARVLDRAEAADVILLFDEADSLFGARTETRDSTDRFANNQTNYLLTRIEAHNGIVLLSTNARQRIDSAFARRIDQVIDIPGPDARQRIALWQAHLGQAADLTPADLTRLANKVDLSGGHIRAITDTAAVIAGRARRMITMADLARATTLHFRGIGQTPPSGLEVDK